MIPKHPDPDLLVDHIGELATLASPRGGPRSGRDMNDLSLVPDGAVAVSGGLQGERSGDPGFGRDDFGNQLQVGLSYNLFSGGLTNARISEARHRLTELEKQLEDRLLTTAADIRSAAAQVQTAQTQVTLQRENASLVQRTRDLVEKEYNAGQGSLVRLNEAQRDLTAAQGNLALALVSLRQAWIQLQTRAGTLLSEYVAN